MGIRGLLALAWALSACGGAPARTDVPVAPVVAAEAAVADTGRPLPVWSVESPEGRVSHILGTFHLGVHLDEVLPPPHQEALERARVLLIEVDMTQVDPTAMLAGAQLPPDEDLSLILGADLWPKLVQRLHFVPESGLRRLGPWIAMSMLMAAEAAQLESARLESVRTGESAPSAEAAGPSTLDVTATERAHARGIPVMALETVDEQIAMMNEIPREAVLEYIRAALTDAPSEQSSLAELMDAYLRGDQAELERIVFDPDEIARSPGVFEILFYRRNDRWLPKVEAELARGDAFVAVGLGHVIGERGLLRLLEARGYRVTRLFAEE